MPRASNFTHRVGPWQWNGDNFDTKIVKEECHQWLGAKGVPGALFGAKKMGKFQMTQARRIAYMQHTGEDIEGMAVRLSCHNRMCVNFAHMSLEPSRRLGPRTKPDAS